MSRRQRPFPCRVPFDGSAAAELPTRSRGQILVSLAIATLAACSRADAPRLVRAEPVTGVPTDLTFYPHVYYGGDDAYLVEGRWYRPGADGWVVFAGEPLELQLVRLSLERK